MDAGSADGVGAAGWVGLGVAVGAVPFAFERFVFVPFVAGAAVVEFHVIIFRVVGWLCGRRGLVWVR